MLIEGCVRKIEDIISTDDIIPAVYKHRYTDPKKLAEFIFYNKYPGFLDGLESPSVLVSSQIFGIGSSREQAVSSLLAAGIKAVISPCFGRIFFRNAWNLGLVALQIEEVLAVENGKFLSIDLERSVLTVGRHKIRFNKIDSNLIASIESGGLLNFIRRKVHAETI